MASTTRFTCAAFWLAVALTVAVLPACSDRGTGPVVSDRLAVTALFQGWQDGTTCTAVAGWAWDANQPHTPIDVSIYDGGTLLANIPANQFRQDLLNAGIGNGVHGFTYNLPPLTGTHAITVMAAGSTTLNGSPQSIGCGAADPLSAFRSCVGLQGAGSTCQLPPHPGGGAYPITQPIDVLRSGIHLIGDTSGQGTVVLQRAASSGDMMRVGDPFAQQPPVSDVVIEGFVFDGGAPSMGCPSADPARPGSCVDFAIYGACRGAASCSGNVTGASDSYAVTVRNCVFSNAPSNAVAFYAFAEPGDSRRRPANDIYFGYNQVNASVLTGILIGGGDNGAGSYATCDAPGNCTGAINDSFYPSNITIEHNTLNDNHTGAMGINIVRYLRLRDNTFQNNYWNPIDGAGGTIFVDECSHHVDILRNTIVGPLASPQRSTDGLELWGKNILAQDNTIHGFPTDGIGANSVCNVDIVNNRIYDNNQFSRVSPGWESPGITIWNRVDHRRTNLVRVAGNQAPAGNAAHPERQSFGVRITRGDSSDPALSNITISSDNDLSNNAVAPYCMAPGLTLLGANPIAFASQCQGCSNSCAGLTCGNRNGCGQTCNPGSGCTSSTACGNGTCESGESGANCAADCCDAMTACTTTKAGSGGTRFCRNMYHYDWQTGTSYWRGFQWITAADALSMCDEAWEAQEGASYQTQYQCGGTGGKCHAVPNGYW